MDGEDRDSDKKIFLVPSTEPGKAIRPISLDVIKTAYIAGGKSAEEIAKEYVLPIEQVKNLIKDHKLPELRQAFIREGLSKIQNKQLHQAERLMEIEVQFKKLRLAQLETQLEDYMAYYGRHGDLYKRHPTTGDILKDQNGIPIQILIPNVSREISQLKESVTLSEGMKSLLHQIDDIINSPKPAEYVGGTEEDGEDIIDMGEFDGLFSKK